MTEIERLRKQASELVYPPNTFLPKAVINGMSFFPCGSGVSTSDGKISDKRIMIVGHDQDNERGFELSKKKGHETYSLTWRKLSALLKSVGIAEKDCFYTNFLMGIRKNATSNIGPSPSLNNSEFVSACASFMIDQLAAQKPQVVLSLGLVPLQLFGLIDRTIHLKYVGVQEFSEIRARGADTTISFQLATIPPVKLIALPHPSSKRRNDATWHPDEIDLLKAVASRLN